LLGLESVKDAEGKIIQEAPLPVWANFRQRALDTAIAHPGFSFKGVIEALPAARARSSRNFLWPFLHPDARHNASRYFAPILQDGSIRTTAYKDNL
jgi:hypothetical protein